MASNYPKKFRSQAPTSVDNRKAQVDMAKYSLSNYYLSEKKKLPSDIAQLVHFILVGEKSKSPREQCARDTNLGKLCPKQWVEYDPSLTNCIEYCRYRLEHWLRLMLNTLPTHLIANSTNDPMKQVMTPINRITFSGTGDSLIKCNPLKPLGLGRFQLDLNLIDNTAELVLYVSDVRIHLPLGRITNIKEVKEGSGEVTMEDIVQTLVDLIRGNQRDGTFFVKIYPSIPISLNNFPHNWRYKVVHNLIWPDSDHWSSNWSSYFGAYLQVQFKHIYDKNLIRTNQCSISLRKWIAQLTEQQKMEAEEQGMFWNRIIF